MIKLGEVEFTIVTSENITETNKVTSYPVEDGSTITDNVDNEPLKLTFTGMINGVGAVEKLSTLRNYRKQKTILTYIGRNILRNCVIESLSRVHDNTIKGGFIFTVTLQELEFAQLTESVVDFTKVFKPVQKPRSRRGRVTRKPVREEVLIYPVVHNYVEDISDRITTPKRLVANIAEQAKPSALLNNNPFEKYAIGN